MHRLQACIKKATTRTKKYGEIGDTFQLEFPHGLSFVPILFEDILGKYLKGKKVILTYQLTEVKKVSLEYVTVHHHEDEGCLYPEEFINVWKTIHPKKGYVPKQNVWFHKFKIINIDIEKEIEI